MINKKLFELDGASDEEQVAELQNTLEETQLIEEKKEESSADWSSGIDLLDIGSAVIDAVVDLVGHIDIDL